jgi:unsaturated rhamnogalacturonyl hydrolase
VKRRGLALGGLAVALGVPGRARAAEPPDVLPSRPDICAAVRKVNDYWIAANPDPGNNQWARATYFSGNMAAYRMTEEPRYLDYARQWAARWAYGLNRGVTTRNADDQCAGQVYYDLYDVSHDPAHVADINESLRLMVYGTQAGRNDDWWWVDALHMAMPVFVRAGGFLADDAYLRKLWKLYYDTKLVRKLYDYTYELWYRDGRFTGVNAIKSPNGKPVFWSRGNGWALAAHAKALSLLNPTERRIHQIAGGDDWRPYRFNITGMARALKTAQRPDGLWNANLADPDHFGGPESSGTALFVFGLAYGIRTHIIDSATYLPVVARAWTGLVTLAVRADGRLGYVQGVGDRPAPTTADETHDFGVGAFLLAGAEVFKLASATC